MSESAPVVSGVIRPVGRRLYAPRKLSEKYRSDESAPVVLIAESSPVVSISESSPVVEIIVPKEKKIRKKKYRRCEGKSKSGEQCKKAAMGESRFCLAHSEETKSENEKEIEERRRRVLQLVLVKKYSVASVAESLGVSSVLVYSDLRVIREEAARQIVTSTQTSEKVKGALVELLKSIEHRINQLWSEYSSITDSEKIPVRSVVFVKNKKGRIVSEKVTETTDPRSVSNLKLSIFSQIRAEEAHMLSALEKFGMISSVIRAQVEGTYGISLEAVTAITRVLAGIINSHVGDALDRKRVIDAFDAYVETNGEKLLLPLGSNET